MKGFRRFLGFALYLFMALPLTFSGLFLSSVRPLADDPSKIKALVSDARFAALLESPDLVAMAPETLRVDGMPLDGKAAAVAFQASIPAHVVVNVAEGAIDTAFEALRSGDASFQIDATPFKRAAIDGASRFADAYLAALATPGTSTAVSTGTVSTGTVSTAVVRAANAQPDEWQLGEAGTRFQTPARISAAGAGAAGAGGALMATGFGLCLASALVAGGTWRRKLGTSGSRILLPSAITMIVGLIPRLIVPGSLIRLPAADAAASLPALAEYLRFAFSTLSGGFLTAGLIGVGIGTLLVSIQRIVPPSEDEEDEGYA